MDRGTYHRARGLFGFGYRAINHRSGRPEGAKGDSPGQSEAPPWDWCARNNPSPERAEPAARKPMCYVSPFQGLGELGRRRAQVAGVPRVALRSTLGYLYTPLGRTIPWKKPGDCPRFFSKQQATHGPRNVPPSAWAVRLWLSRDQPSIRPPQRGAR